MCVYLAPRWRRRSSPLLVMIVLALALLLTVQGRTLRSQETGSGSGSTQVGQQEVGVVTTPSTTTVTKAWNSGDSSQLGDQKSVSFDSLVKTTTEPIEHSTEQSKEASSASATMDHEILTRKTSSIDGSCEGKGKDAGDASTKQDDNDDGSFDENEKDESDDSNADSKTNHTTIFKPNDKAITKTGTFNKATTPPLHLTPEPTPSTPGSTPTATIPALPPHPGTFEAKPKGWTSKSGSFDAKPKSWSLSSGSSEQSVTGQSYEESGSINSAQALENKTKSASLTTSSRALDQTLVVVIVGVVGAIGALLMFVSRKVLKETGDDKDLENTSIF